MATSSYDLAVEEQVEAEQLKASQTEEMVAIIAILASGVSKSLLEQQEDLSGRGWAYRRNWLERTMKSVNKQLTAGVGKFYSQLEATAGAFAGLEVAGLQKLLNTKLNVVKKASAFKAALDLPMSSGGQLLKQYVDSLISTETNRIIGTLRMGLTQGKSNAEISRSLIGTRKLRYQDGSILVTKRNAQAVIQTATQHVESAARMKVWQKNADVVRGYEWVSVLDNRTSSTCRSLDGQRFFLGGGPIPPAHTRCRSTIYALVDDNGAPDTDQDYYTWLKGKNAKYQDSILGPTRGKIFRDGGLSTDEFAKLNLNKSFKPKTLDQMRVENPEAFDLAGV
jgi:SPP1 gp7 family putative phage head morphogenesis protein